MEQKAEKRQPLQGSRVLIAEDEFLIALDMKETLSEAGAEIVGPCATLATALDAARDETISAAVLDIRLGRETTEFVAGVLAEKGVPFVFCSGQVVENGQQPRRQNARILSKPVRQSTLIDAVVQLVRR